MNSIKLEYIGNWSQAKGGRLPPARKTVKVNRKFHSHYLYLGSHQ